MGTEREIFQKAIRRINRKRNERGEPPVRYIIELDGKVIKSKSKYSNGLELLQCLNHPMIQCHRTCHKHQSAVWRVLAILHLHNRR